MKTGALHGSHSAGQSDPGHHETKLRRTASISVGGCSMNPDFTKWLDMVWEALAEEDLTKRERMLQDAHRVLDKLRQQHSPQANPAA
jgi:hypothetical protein